MKVRYLIVPALATLMLAGTAFAATPAEKCAALEKQFDQVIGQHESAKKATAAKELRTEGGTLCTEGKAPEGIKKLEQALKDIGVKVMY